MISLRLKSSISIALICFVLGCFTAFLLTATCGSPKQPAITSATLLKAQADSLHTHYQTTIAKLEKNNKELDAELQNTKAELKAAKAKANSKAAEIKKIITPPGYPAKDLLNKPTASLLPVGNDLEKCDSLVMLISEFLQDTEHKDSLYEAQLLQQDNLIAGKDAIIKVQENENLNLSFLLKQSLTQQTLLEKDNLKLHKKMKRQRSACKWLAFGSAVLSGITTHYLFNR